MALLLGGLEGGTLLTTRIAAKLGKPCLVAQLEPYDAARSIAEFLEREAVRTLNVAGPRESRHPGIQARAHRVLVEVFGRGDRGRGIILR